MKVNSCAMFPKQSIPYTSHSLWRWSRGGKPQHISRGGQAATVSVAKDCSIHTLKFDLIVILAEMSAYQKVNMVKRLIKKKAKLLIIDLPIANLVL